METNGKRNLDSITSGEPTESKKTCFSSVKQEGSGSERNPMPGGRLTGVVIRMEHGNMKKASDNCNDVEGFHGQRPRSRKQMQSSKSKTSNGLESDLLPKSSWTKEDNRRVVREQLELLLPDLVNSFMNTFKRTVVTEIRLSLEDIIQRVVREQLELLLPDLVNSSMNTFKRTVVPEIRSSLEDIIPRVIREELKHTPCQSAQLVRSSGTCQEKDEERNLKLRFVTDTPPFVYSGQKLKGEVKLVNANTGTIVESGPESSVWLEVVAVKGHFEREDDDNWTRDEFEKFLAEERKEKGKGPLLRGSLRVKLDRGTGVLDHVEFTDNSKCTKTGQYRIGLRALHGHCENIREAITGAFTVKENRGKSNQKHFPPSPNDDVWRLTSIAKNGPLCKKLNDAGIDKVKDFLRELDMDPEKLRKILGAGIPENKWKDLIAHAKSCPLNGEPHVCHDYESDHGVGQCIGLTADGVDCAADKFSLEQKGKAGELNGETFSGSMQKKGECSFSSKVCEGQIENVTAVPHNLAPPVNAGSPAEGHNGVTLASSVRSQNTNSENTEYSGYGRITAVYMPTRPREGNHVTAEAQSTDMWVDGIIITDGIPPDVDTTFFDVDTFFQSPPESVQSDRGASPDIIYN